MLNYKIKPIMYSFDYIAPIAKSVSESEDKICSIILYDNLKDDLNQLHSLTITTMQQWKCAYKKEIIYIILYSTNLPEPATPFDLRSEPVIEHIISLFIFPPLSCIMGDWYLVGKKLMRFVNEAHLKKLMGNENVDKYKYSNILNHFPSESETSLITATLEEFKFVVI